MKTKKGYCKNCNEKLKPTGQLLNGFICPICHNVYLKDRIGRYRFYY